MAVQVPRAGYVAGNTIAVNLRIENQSTHPIQSFSVKLIEVIRGGGGVVGFAFEKQNYNFNFPDETVDDLSSVSGYGRLLRVHRDDHRRGGHRRMRRHRDG